MCLKFNVWKISVSSYYSHFYSKDCTKFIMWLGNIIHILYTTSNYLWFYYLLFYYVVIQNFDKFKNYK